MPQKISITGHTDSSKFGSGAQYTNWELSADRANAIRRALIEFAVPPERIAKVVGAAANEPLVIEDPSAARNRRIAIVLLRGSGGRGSESERTNAAAGVQQEGHENLEEHENQEEDETDEPAERDQEAEPPHEEQDQ